jgi:hypothetical protein
LERKADEAVDEARAEHDLDNPAEAHMFSKLTYLWIKHKIALLQGETKLAQSGMSGEDAVDADESLSAENQLRGHYGNCFPQNAPTSRCPRNAMVR